MVAMAHPYAPLDPSESTDSVVSRLLTGTADGMPVGRISLRPAPEKRLAFTEQFRSPGASRLFGRPLDEDGAIAFDPSEAHSERVIFSSSVPGLAENINAIIAKERETAALVERERIRLELIAESDRQYTGNRFGARALSDFARRLEAKP